MVIELQCVLLLGQLLIRLYNWMEVVLPIEVEIPSLRVIMEADLNEVEWMQSIYD